MSDLICGIIAVFLSGFIFMCGIAIVGFVYYFIIEARIHLNQQRINNET